MQFMLDISLPLVALSTIGVTLALFKLLDRLVNNVKKVNRVLRVALAIANGILAAITIKFYNSSTPTVLLLLCLDTLYALEHAIQTKDTTSTYYFAGSAIFFNKLMLYVFIYSLCRFIPFDVISAGNALYQRVVFILCNIVCMGVIGTFHTPFFPLQELKYIIHSSERKLLNVYFPLINAIFVLNCIFILPMIEGNLYEYSAEIGFHLILAEWAAISEVSCYIIVVYQAHRVRVRNTMQNKIDEEERQKLEWKERADRQPLTGLLNRRAWEKKVKGIITTGGRGYLVMLDLDHFKEVNDNFGHPEGDWILKETANMMRQAFRDTDIIGHIGGDEFCIFLPGTFSRESVERRLEQLMNLRRKDFQSKSGDMFTLSFSAGYVKVEEYGETLEKLMATADCALYWQKEHGRDGFIMYNPKLMGEVK